MKFRFYIIIMMVFLLTACQNNNKKELTTDEYPLDKSSENYNLEKFNQLNNIDAENLFNESGTHVIFICESNVKNCVKSYEAVEKVQNDFNYVTDYIYIYDTFREKFVNFLSKLDMYYEVSSETKGTFGYLLGYQTNVTYFPAIVIIKDGKQVDGLLSLEIEYNDLYNLVKKYLS